MESMPLVSVTVITYNSSKYVLETLESIKAQTYQNIELIISDDCSADDTVSVCRKWIEQNKERFIRTVLLTSPHNTGISANGNRAEAACHGEWVKGIAGDDLLLPDCIELFLKFVGNNPEPRFIFGKIQTFGDVSDSVISDDISWLFKLSPKEMLDQLAVACYLPAPAYFYNLPYAKSIHISNDERIPMMEDWPKWINILKRNEKIYYLNEYVVNYRLSQSSISTGGVHKNNFSIARAQFYIYYQFELLFKRKPSLYLLMRLLHAHHSCNEMGPMWKVLWTIYEAYHRITGKSIVINF